MSLNRPGLPPEPDGDADETARTRALADTLDRHAGRSCARCPRLLCGHEVLVGVFMGFEDAPLCLDCLARGLDQPADQFRDHAAAHLLHRECYRRAWDAASAREGLPQGPRPSCLWPAGSPPSADPARSSAAAESSAPAESLFSEPPLRGRGAGGEGAELPASSFPLTPPPLPRVQGRGASGTDSEPPVAAEAAATWDAGDMGCGDLVLALRVRLQALAPGSLLRVTARDPAAPEDLPAWCRLTGHRLVRAVHPTYDIRKKET